jgi:hypothetical protein
MTKEVVITALLASVLTTLMIVGKEKFIDKK